jgi:hypothetical protein
MEKGRITCRGAQPGMAVPQLLDKEWRGKETTNALK